MATKTTADILKRRLITPADREAIDEIKHVMLLEVRAVFDDEAVDLTGER